jgi:hypothetical protein
MSGKTQWRKSSYSGAGGGTNECVELLVGTEQATVRDSKRPDGGALVFTAAGFHSFLGAVKDGRIGHRG